MMDEFMTDLERFIANNLKNLNRMEIDEVIGGLKENGKI